MANSSLVHQILCFASLLPMLALAENRTGCETSGNIIDERACAQQKFASKDRQLNAVYQTVLKQLDTYEDDGRAANKSLIISQRRWVEFRDADCAAHQKLYQGGSASAEIYLGCMTKHTEQRIKELDPVSWQAG